MIRGVHHISMNCSEEQLPEAKHFYSDLLGLQIVREWPKGIMVEAGNCWIEIMIGDANHLKGAVRHFAFYVDDTDETAARLSEAGYELFDGPRDICIASEPPVPARIAFVRGPLGEEVELFNDRSVNAGRFINN
ncbi:MAG: VOC family protein [Erysipelotrichaceae bacterium]|nr:VOC family protein [Erysipelotrichaceae bacterium]